MRINLPSFCLTLGLTLGFAANGAVNVRGIGSSSGETVTVEVYADIATIPIVSHSFKLFYDPAVLHVVQASRNEDVWHFADGPNRLPYVEPDASVPGQILFLGGRLNAADPSAGVLGNNVLLGLAIFGRHTHDTPSFDVTIGRQGDYASFVTRDGAVLESLPGEVVFEGVRPVKGDKDLDGLGDEWEVEFFEDIERAFYSDDPDKDGSNNRNEEGFGTNPTDPRSHLAFSVSLPDPRLLVLEWFSTQGRIYAVESSGDLQTFRSLLTGVKATPPRNELQLELSGKPQTLFYRIRLESFPEL